MKLLKISILALGTILLNVSCSDRFTDTEFYQSQKAGDLTSIAEVESFIRGVYSSMRAATYLGKDYLAYAEVRSDEMYSTGASGRYTVIRNYTMTGTDANALETYQQIYTAIGKANIVINTDINAISGSDADKARVKFLQGQALALRGLLAFDLLKLYGQKYSQSADKLGVVYPLVYDPAAKEERGTIEQNEAQIEKDFKEGLALMEANAANDPTTKTELSIDAVKGLMTRFYLYKEDYANVRTLVADLYGKKGISAVITKDAFRSSWSLNNAASNSLFELATGIKGGLGTTSLPYIYRADGYANTRVLPEMYESYADEDIRKELITIVKQKHYLTYKHPQLQGRNNIKLLRYEEVLLNGVEAELNGGSANTALEYYNAIITNRGLVAVGSVDMTTLKAERKKELLGEGFRYWDLLRWKETIPYYTTAGTRDASKDKKLGEEHLAFPIPSREVSVEGSKVKPNPGYGQ